MERERLSFADAASVLKCDAGTVWRWTQENGDAIKPMRVLRERLERALRRSEATEGV